MKLWAGGVGKPIRSTYYKRQSVSMFTSQLIFIYIHTCLQLFNYNDWGIAVMEDEGMLGDHTAGVGANDGKWHHIAVTWRSYDGQTKLYDNGYEVWSVTRAKGKLIPSGGTLVVGREQDCEGGCFDSEKGAAGDVSPSAKQEYAEQDFYGLIDEMRVWRKARTQEQIAAGMRAALTTKGHTGGRGGSSGAAIDPKDPDLVAYWNFDEGKGYTIRDVTGRGHNLMATQPTLWEVVRWLAVCGNGVLEPGEECDDGHTIDGDGCSSECKVESGWECTATSPSKCWKRGPGGGGQPPQPGPGPTPGGGSGGGSGEEKKRHALRSSFATVASLAVVGVLVGLAYTQRATLFDRFPVVEDTVALVREYLGNGMSRIWGGGRQRGYGNGGGLEIDPGDVVGSPEFTRFIPERGGYTSLPSHAPGGP